MKPTAPFLKSAPLLLLLTFLSAGGAVAQLNENKITRDASGVYKGKITGGTMTWVPLEGMVSPGPGPVSTGKARVPIDDGKSKSKLNDDNISGDGTATASGRAKDPKVTRGGKLIKHTVKGSVVNPGAGSSLQGGVLRGSFADKGSKWKAAFLGAGEQIFDSGDKWVYSGRKFSGKD